MGKRADKIVPGVTAVCWATLATMAVTNPAVAEVAWYNRPGVYLSQILSDQFGWSVDPVTANTVFLLAGLFSALQFSTMFSRR